MNWTAGGFRLALVVALVSCLVACSTTQSRFAPLGGKSFPPRDESFQITVFDQPPSRSYDRVARLDVHFEKSAWQESNLQEALPELKKQARLAGADAIVDIKEQRSQVAETKMYHVTATAIRFQD
ncbi:MAG TPA: hypothetical protein VIT67_14310 [Povalibacter sp.]